MPTKSYADMLLEELRDPDLAAEYLSAALEVRSVEAFQKAIKAVVDSHGGVDVLLEITGLSRKTILELFEPTSEIPFRTLLSVLKGLGISLSFLADERTRS